MNPFQFSYGPRLNSGAGSAARLGEVLPEGRCLFVTDAQILKLGPAGAAIDSVEAAGREVRVFDVVEFDPCREALMAAAEAGTADSCVSIVGFGGGSPMDVAKLAAYLTGSGDDLDDRWGVGKATGRRLPRALVPTAPGTGSEATPPTVITVVGAEKRGVNSPALVADWVSEAMKQERPLVSNPYPITPADARRRYEAAL